VYKQGLADIKSICKSFLVKYGLRTSRGPKRYVPKKLFFTYPSTKSFLFIGTPFVIFTNGVSPSPINPSVNCALKAAISISSYFPRTSPLNLLSIFLFA